MRARILAVVVAALALVASGCEKRSDSTSGAGQGSSGGSGATSGEIVIGHYASMTGSEANFGISTDNGIKLAVKEKNSAGGVNGRQVRLITQ